MMYSLTATECDELLQIDDRPRGEHLADFGFLVARRRGENLLFLVGGGIVDLDVEHEPVELRFGQRIGAFLLDRVLRGDREERIGQVVGRLADRHFALLHRLQQRGLRLRRRAVDFVGQQDVGEDRPLDEAEIAACRARLLPARWCR